MDQKDIKPDLANKNLLAQNINNIKNMNKANKRSNLKIILLFIALIFVITSAAGAILIAKHKIDIGNKQARQDNSLINKKDNQSEPIIGDAWQFNLIKPAFAGYRETTTDIIPALANTHAELSTAENLASFSDEGIEFSDEQKKLLNKNGFVLAENNIIKDQADFSAKDDFIDMYDNFDGSNNLYYREPNDAVFITSDLALHLYHILIDRSFQRIEETKFQPMLRAMSEALFSDSLKKYNAAKNNDLKNSYKRLSAYYLIPLTILNAGNQSAELDIKPEAYETYAQYLEAMNNAQIKNSSNNLNFYLSKETDANINLSQEIYELAEAELQLINNAKGLAASPLFTPIRPEFLNDYSQFKPRSHYTKNDILKSYFIAMMWYGRMGFTLNSPELTRDALLITGQINNLETAAGKLSKIWSDMMAIIDFFVGEVDDLTAFQYTDIIKKVYGENVNEGQFFDENLLQKFKQTAIQDLPLPKILSEAILMENYDSQTKEELLASTLQFRFMGQRFTPDAYIINKLTQGDEAPDPKTGQRLPTMPTALMPIHVIAPDNNIVKAYLDEWINNPARIAKQGRESDKIINKTLNELKSEFAGYSPKIWTQNIYWSWLNCYRPLLTSYDSGYPWFMRNDNWQRKNLGTVLGSYAELKHDTLLYAKQSYAELGAGGDNPDEIPPVAKGYVEPDLEFWNRIISLAKTTRSGLEDRDVFPKIFESKFNAFIEASEFFALIAGQELQNQIISDDDFEKLRTISSKLSRVANPVLGQELTKKEKRSGIIADIHTDVVNQEILYEATGKPCIIYALVKDANGARLTRGAVFNHYEFTNNLDERLSDEDWQARIYEQAAPLPPADKWTNELIK